MSRKQEQGSVLVEAILILPLIILIAIAGVEFTRSLRTYKLAMTFSKEVSNLAFRDCSDQVTIKKRQCLATLQNNVNLFANQLMPGTEIYLTVLFDKGGTIERESAGPPGPSKFCTTKGPSFCGSHFASGPAPNLNNISLLAPGAATLLESQGFLVVGEAWLPHESLMGPVTAMFSLQGSTQFYDATIL